MIKLFIDPEVCPMVIVFIIHTAVVAAHTLRVVIIVSIRGYCSSHLLCCTVVQSLSVVEKTMLVRAVKNQPRARGDCRRA